EKLIHSPHVNYAEFRDRIFKSRAIIRTQEPPATDLMIQVRRNPQLIQLLDKATPAGPNRRANFMILFEYYYVISLSRDGPRSRQAGRTSARNNHIPLHASSIMADNSS